MKKLYLIVMVSLLSLGSVTLAQTKTGWNKTPLKDFHYYHQYFSKYTQMPPKEWSYDAYPWNESDYTWSNVFLPWGKVGLGTLEPEVKFHVIGNSFFDGNVNANILHAGELSAHILAIESDLTVGNNFTVMGRLGVGIPSPTEKIDVDGNIKASGSIWSSELYSEELYLATGNVTENFTVGKNLYVEGNVGLGIPDPTYKLEIDGNLKVIDIISSGTITGNNFSGNKLTVNQNAYFKTMVGIGVENPSEKLDVDGSIKALNLFLTHRLTTQDIRTNTISIEDMNASGRVAIGVREAAERLHVGGTIRGDNLIVDNDFSTINLDASYGTMQNLIVTSRLGIGVENPTEMFEVGGNASFAGDVTANSLVVNSIITPGSTLGMGHFSVQGVTIEEGLTIGTDYMPQEGNYRLAVNGDILAQKVKVRLFDDWPDYVFNDNYQLTSIDKLESFIQANKHLPGIPSAIQMEEEELDLAQMQVKLLEKVEELTLYVIQLNKENQELKERLSNMEAQIQ